jgi:hypothetical protein
MITEEYHVSPDGERTRDSLPQSWTTINFSTDAVINGVKIPLWKFGTYERTIGLEVSVDGVVVHTTSRVLDADTPQQTKFFQSFDAQVSVNAGSVLVLSVFGIGTGAPDNSVYTYRTRYDTGFAMPFGYHHTLNTTDTWLFVTECILDISYAPIWVVDGQNDGYPRIVGYDAVGFEEFEKDADGYPLNWGVWKLDGQNDGYPWPTGFIPSHAVGGGIYKKINGILYPVSIYKKVNGVLYPVLIYKKVNGSLMPI